MFAPQWFGRIAAERRLTGINSCKPERGATGMSTQLLEHLRDRLIAYGAVQNTPEFCRCWLGRSEGYIRTLRYHQSGPSIETLAMVRSLSFGHRAGAVASYKIDHEISLVCKF